MQRKGAAVSLNPRWTSTTTASPSACAVDVEAFHTSLPGFRRSPLIPLPDVAATLGVDRVYVKCEHDRIGLPSFKILGASWATNYAIATQTGLPTPRSFIETMRLAESLPGAPTLTTATDGNHGRAVAHMAALLGLQCVVYAPAGTATARITAIESEGAQVLVVDGSYDDAVRLSASEASRNPQQILVSDTSWPGYEAIPSAVVAGYGTIFREAYAQLADLGETTYDVALVPAGVGALASSAVASLHRRRCSVITVEPLSADCVRRSLTAGDPVVVPGPHHSIMAGLNCGEVSRIAWPVLCHGVRAAVAVSDEEAMEAVRVLAAAGIRSGESGAAALAGATALAQDAAGAALLASDRCRIVLLLDTEGVTDPDGYETIVGVQRPSRDGRGGG